MNRNLGSLNGIAILSVIAAHAAGWVFTAMFFWTNRYLPVSVPDYRMMNTPVYYLFVFFNVATIFSVPAFLFMSGFFAAYITRTSKGFTWKTVLTRIRELFFPYLVWSLVVFAYQAWNGQVFTPLVYLEKVLTGKALPHYYYVAVIVQLYIVAIWLLPFVQKHWKWALGAALAAQIVSIAPNYLRFINGLSNPIPTTFFTTFVFYFAFGAAVFYNSKRIIDRLHAWKWWLLAGALIALAAALIETESIFQRFQVDFRGGVITIPSMAYAILFMLAFLGFSRDLNLTSRWLTLLGQRAYGVYLIQPLILEFVSRAVYHFLPFFLGWYIPFFIVIYIAGLSIPLAFAWAIRKVNGRLYPFLFG